MKRHDFISLTSDCEQNLGIDYPLPLNTGVYTSNEGPGVPDFDQPIHHNPLPNPLPHTQNQLSPKYQAKSNSPRSLSKSPPPPIIHMTNMDDGGIWVAL